MNLVWLPRGPSPGWRRLALLPALLLIGGCGREEIRVYTAPKDAPAPSVATRVRPRNMALPPPEWTLPAGWRELGARPGQMSVASFAVPGSSGQEAQVTITPLPVMAGRESLIVNMWREQMGEEPLSEEEAKKQFQPVEVGGQQGSLFEIKGQGNPQPERTLTAMAHRADASWFIKLSGDAAVVEAQKPVFFEFLRTMRIKEGAEANPGSPDQAARFNWQVPAHWKAMPAGDMQAARFALPERGGAKAEVFVSVFGSDTGGTLANVNRWRREIGLREVDDAGLPQVILPLDPADPKTKLVDLTNNNRRLVAAIVPRDGRYWFYKLRGDLEAVSPERDAFVAFVKSTP